MDECDRPATHLAGSHPLPICSVHVWIPELAGSIVVEIEGSAE
jgi:hypothetical protein